ncbi:MAG: GNAT family N-acetyltransferase [Sideroxyarcus sp.]|jgi:GNAT superfamily N-acetyltransferase|nr:GNAT family N-acetyltransferase [Sideroxyarcus sp.]
MEIEIFYAEHSDLEQLVDLLAELFTLENDFHPDRGKQSRGLRLILDNPVLGKLFVLRDQSRVVGMANVLITASTSEGCLVAVLEDVIVRGEYRGKGLGRRLVEHILAWARMEGLARVTLLADRDNKAALGFYRKLCFEHSHMVVLRRGVASSSSC